MMLRLLTRPMQPQPGVGWRDSHLLCELLFWSVLRLLTRPMQPQPGVGWRDSHLLCELLFWSMGKTAGHTTFHLM